MFKKPNCIVAHAGCIQAIADIHENMDELKLKIDALTTAFEFIQENDAKKQKTQEFSNHISVLLSLKEMSGTPEDRHFIDKQIMKYALNNIDIPCELKDRLAKLYD